MNDLTTEPAASDREEHPSLATLPAGASQDATARLVTDIVQALCKPPYYTRLKGGAPTEDRQMTEDLVKRIANTPPHKPGSTSDSRAQVSFTVVRVDPETSWRNLQPVSYSRTNRPLVLHSDSSYKRDPHELVVFQMVRADDTGGETIMMPVDRIMQALDPATIDMLRRPIFPFSQGPLPILWEQEGLPCIRYYRAQILSSGGEDLPDEARKAMATLDGVLRQVSLQDRFRLLPGETLFINNVRVLHGRTGFAKDSNRMMYRFRVHAGCLT